MNKEKLKNYFLQNPTVKLRVRQIEREVKIPLPSVIRYCKELKKEKILYSENIANIKVYTANFNSKVFKREKQLYNLRSLYESGLIDYLIKNYLDPKIILFGSYAWGDDTEESDIDIYIETSFKEELDLRKFEIILDREIQVFKHKKILDIKNKHLINSIINGINIHGSIDVV